MMDWKQWVGLVIAFVSVTWGFTEFGARGAVPPFGDVRWWHRLDALKIVLATEAFIAALVFGIFMMAGCSPSFQSAQVSERWPVRGGDPVGQRDVGMDSTHVGDDNHETKTTPDTATRAPYEIHPSEIHANYVHAVSMALSSDDTPPLRINGGLVAFTIFARALSVEYPYVNTFALKLGDQAPLLEHECRTTKKKDGDPGTTRCTANTSSIGGTVLVQDGPNLGETLTFIACGIPCWDYHALQLRQSTNVVSTLSLDLVR